MLQGLQLTFDPAWGIGKLRGLLRHLTLKTPKSSCSKWVEGARPLILLLRDEPWGAGPGPASCRGALSSSRYCWAGRARHSLPSTQPRGHSMATCCPASAAPTPALGLPPVPHPHLVKGVGGGRQGQAGHLHQVWVLRSSAGVWALLRTLHPSSTSLGAS